MKYYAVANGRKIGVFNNWEEAEKSVKGFKDAMFKSFKNYEDAANYVERLKVTEEKPLKLQIIESVMSQYFYNGMGEQEAYKLLLYGIDELMDQLKDID